MQDHATLKESFERAGQGHVFKHYDDLSEQERAALDAQAAEIDLDELAGLIDTLVVNYKPKELDLGELAPAPCIPLPQHRGEPTKWAEARRAGEEALRADRVAAFTVAGGQGTRLGYPGPKGTFPVSPVRQAPLFRVFAEKILGARERHGARIPWFVMTSHANHGDTEAFFRENAFFGLGEESVMFFRQGRMPAVDMEGKILMEEKARIALSPDGHGGSLRALVRSGAAERMREEGLDVLSYFQVDNPLVTVIDPAFIGFHILGGSEMSSKMIPKAYPEEKVGVFCHMGGRLHVIEYSDMPEELMTATAPDGELLYNAGSIAIHILSRAFVERVGGSAEHRLPFHRAAKKVAALDSDGNKIEPTAPNAIKFETFVFDALPLAKDPVVVETDRAEDFSPVKNAEGLDSPQTCRDDQLRMWTRWLVANGEQMETDDSGKPAFAFEISPRFADDPLTFAERWAALSERPALREGTVVE